MITTELKTDLFELGTFSPRLILKESTFSIINSKNKLSYLFYNLNRRYIFNDQQNNKLSEFENKGFQNVIIRKLQLICLNHLNETR